MEVQNSLYHRKSVRKVKGPRLATSLLFSDVREKKTSHNWCGEPVAQPILQMEEMRVAGGFNVLATVHVLSVPITKP